MDIQPRTYYRGLYGRESGVVLYPLLTVHVSPIYARSEYVYPPEREPSGAPAEQKGEGTPDAARKRHFVLFRDTISWKFAFYCQIRTDTVAHFELRAPWIEVTRLSARRITRTEQWPREYWSFPEGSSR